ncbi:ribosomal protein S18-alanine N-acetyltransferase [Trichocoleus desertorum]|uniref:Ribosomal protein S18-alanine N-acetyltransferase n=1 Tax=Trichocoleus desertorum GB2-A4 TaxID=2933944 RepID=A0ABV0J225_9CYAN|nr:ribosomal protein S18-alanine N-acetyltransferase [Trichocoleus sp. FACHB-46]
MNFLDLQSLTPELLPATLVLDQLCFGGLWTLEGYRRELESPNSELLVLQTSQAHQTLEKQPIEPIELGSKDDPAAPLVGLGCFWAIVDEAHITIVAVHPNYQAQGLGQTLLYALLKKARQRGLDRATLEVRASNQPALLLYEKFGFQEAGRRRRYYEETGEDALILWRGGLQSPEFGQALIDWQAQVQARLHQAGWHLRGLGNP